MSNSERVIKLKAKYSSLNSRLNRMYAKQANALRLGDTEHYADLTNKIVDTHKSIAHASAEIERLENIIADNSNYYKRLFAISFQSEEMAIGACFKMSKEKGTYEVIVLKNKITGKYEIAKGGEIGETEEHLPMYHFMDGNGDYIML